MTDLRTLHDAFAELEHRADRAEMNRRVDTVDPAALPKRRPRTLRSMPVVATVAAVAALIVGANWLVPGDYAGTKVTGPTVPAGPPSTHEELVARFRAVLGDKATVVVTKTGRPQEFANDPDPQPSTGLSIEGSLTVNGVTGEFSLSIYLDRTCDNTVPPCQTPTECDESAQAAIPDYRNSYGVGFTCSRASADGRVKLDMQISGRRELGSHDPLRTPLSPVGLARVINSDLWW